MTRSALREALRINNKRLGDVLAMLEDQGLVERCAGGWQAITRPMNELLGETEAGSAGAHPAEG